MKSFWVMAAVFWVFGFINAPPKMSDPATAGQIGWCVLAILAAIAAIGTTP